MVIRGREITEAVTTQHLGEHSVATSLLHLHYSYVLTAFPKESNRTSRSQREE